MHSNLVARLTQRKFIITIGIRIVQYHGKVEAKMMSNTNDIRGSIVEFMRELNRLLAHVEDLHGDVALCKRALIRTPMEARATCG